MSLAMHPCGVITMITDLGTQDGYVGAMKGVIQGIYPGARVVDISHQIDRHDLLQAALVLRHVCPYFPPGSVHLVVVDPGVGGERKPLAAETSKFIFVGPDNGVLSPALEDDPAHRVVAIENARYRLPQLSDTFHGRDLFAPTAAHCALGVPVEEFGPPVDGYSSLQVPRPQMTPQGLRGQIIAVDHFGNLVTDISREDLERYAGTAAVLIQLGETTISRISHSYQEVPQGAAVAIIGSWGMLEIALNGGDACAVLGAQRGDIVMIRRRPHG